MGLEPAEAERYIAKLDAMAVHERVPFAEGRAMHWRIYGEGDPLVLVHGGHGSWLHWVRNIEVLAREHQVFVPDLPGFGDSADPPDGADIDNIAGALCVSLDALLGSRRSVDLAAFSYGGAVSARVAIRRGRIRRLALLGTPGTGTPSRRRAQMLRWRRADPVERDAALRHNLLAHMMYAEENVDALAFRAYANAVTATRFRSRGSAHRILLEEILKDYAEPVLLLYGEHDVICTPALAIERLAKPLSGRECRIVPDSGHWVQFERADAVNDVLERWFAEA
jgi:2-hydroxy-6-oxonona-2,4-dienedioate hydrolase